MGYPLGQKAYKLYDLESINYLPAETCFLFGDIFPFQAQPATDSSSPHQAQPCYPSLPIVHKKIVSNLFSSSSHIGLSSLFGKYGNYVFFWFPSSKSIPLPSPIDYRF
ncbi:hypothetical protein ACOSQ3_014002 [Xanthoceras sorbifolium]